MAKLGRPIKELPDAFAMIAAGWKPSVIARALGVTGPTVVAWASRNGVAINGVVPKPRQKGSRPRAPKIIKAKSAKAPVVKAPRFCECCGKADISHRPPAAKYCLPCRNSGLVLYAPRKAVNLVNTMVRAGLLAKPTDFACVDCGEPAECYDHRDYLKPMDVEPVCDACNFKRGTAANKFPWASRNQVTQPAAPP